MNTHFHHAIVIDDHPLVARGIADFLISHCHFEQAHAITSVDALWQQLQHHPPQLIVLDFWLPEGTSLPLLKQLHEQCPKTALLVISADDDTVIQNKVCNMGASGFIHKQESPDVFAQVVETLLMGKTWFPSAEHHAQRNAQPKEIPVTAAELGLTTRQGEVLVMVLMGLPNKRIAQKLSLSEQTVKEHVTCILERLQVKTRVEIITKLRGRRVE